MALPTADIKPYTGLDKATRNTLPDAAATTAEADRRGGDVAVPTHMSAQDAALHKAFWGAVGDTPPTLPTNATGLLGFTRKIVDSLLSLVTGVTLSGANAAIPTTTSMILVPPTVNQLAATGTVQAQIEPGGVYTFCIAIDNATLGATANTIASCTTVAYTGTNLATAQTVSTANTTGLQVGQLLAGTGIVPGAYITSINAGVSFTMSIPASASGTVTLNVMAGAFAGNFQSSPDGTNWTNVNVVPKTYLVNAAPTNSFVAPGLWTYFSTNTDKYLRFNLTSINATGALGNLSTNPRLRFDIDAFDRNAAPVNLPYVSYVAATAATFPTGLPVLMPVDMGGFGFASINIQTLTGTSQSVVWRQSNDPSGTTFTGLGHLTNQQAQNAVAVSTTAAGEFILAPSARYLSASMNAGTAVTACTISGSIAHVGSAQAAAQVVNSINNQPMNVAQIGGGGAVCSTIQGSSNTALGVYVGGSNNSTLTTTAFAGSGATNGATQAFTGGGGTTMAFDISITTLTLGTATSVIFSIDESYDNGTTWSSIWTTDPVTATSHVRVPPLFITGRVRLRAWSIGGTSTTVTVTTNVMASGASAVIQRQMTDVFAATNPFTSLINGTGFTSTLVSTTLNSVSAVALVEGCKVLTVGGVFTGGTPTTAPVYTLQISQDGTNWFSTTTTFSPTAAGTFMATLNGVAARFARLTVTTASAGGTAYGVTKTFINGTN